MALRWYVVHAYSGMEKAVERNLRERIDRSELQDKFGRILVPTEEVVELARVGTPGAAEFIITRYRSLVETKARAYFVLGADHDDVVQEGMIGLCKAIRDFREDRLNKFRPFAELCVTRQIITAVKTATRHKHSPLNASISLKKAGVHPRGCQACVAASIPLQRLP